MTSDYAYRRKEYRVRMLSVYYEFNEKISM